MWKWLAFVAVLTACQTEPTKINVTQEREFVQVQSKAEKPLDVQEETTVLDVRASFTYGLNHIRNSLLFPWTNLAENAQKGEILRDSHQAALRLALLGLTPETPVLIVGEGRSGNGEEGRLAWSMLYFGYHDVQVASVEALRSAMTQDPSAPAKNVPIPKLELRPDLQISADEFKKSKDLAIDVRSSAEAKSSGYKNIEWKEFYTAQGRPDYRVKKKLVALGITPQTKVILISNRGVRSASAAYALLALGFTRVKNFTMGFNALR